MKSTFFAVSGQEIKIPPLEGQTIWTFLSALLLMSGGDLLFELTRRNMTASNKYHQKHCER